jgi:hypothetical protein
MAKRVSKMMEICHFYYQKHLSHEFNCYCCCSQPNSSSIRPHRPQPSRLIRSRGECKRNGEKASNIAWDIMFYFIN